MIIAWALSWWYGAGWKARALMARDRLAQSMDYFSIDSLLKNLFSPFRQIDAGKVRGPLAVQWRSFVDRSLSRIIGAGIRSVIILVGILWLSIQVVTSILLLLLWAIVPLLPIVGLIAAASGWVLVWR